MSTLEIILLVLAIMMFLTLVMIGYIAWRLRYLLRALLWIGMMVRHIYKQERRR